MEFIEALKNRRSVYTLSKESPISDERIIEIVKDATRYTPSAFNCQSQRVVVLFGKNHDALWDIAESTLRKAVPQDKFSATEKKIGSFRQAYGTVLFFNEDGITADLQAKFPLYSENFPIWAEQANGMLQLAIWSLLEAEGLGVNMQHYNPLIDEEVRTAFDLPKSFRLIAQMPFGRSTGKIGAKEFDDIDTRVKVMK